MIHLFSRFAILVPSNTTQQSTTDRSQTRENHIADERSASGSEESVHTAALLLLDVFCASAITIPPSTSAPAASAAPVTALVVLVVIAAIVVVFAAAINGLILTAKGWGVVLV